MVTMPPKRTHTQAATTKQDHQVAWDAVRYLSRRDTRLAALIRRIGPHRPIITRNPFVALVGAVLQQQVSMSAATAIHGRLKELCPRKRITPSAILALEEDQLRTAGLSRQKARYVLGLAEAYATGVLSTRKLRRMSDEQVVETTTQLKGIGRWTAEMLLIFCLERPDVWPIDDLGLQKAARLFLELDQIPDSATLRALGEPWRPYRSYATWYLWRSLAGPLMPGIAL